MPIEVPLKLFKVSLPGDADGHDLDGLRDVQHPVDRREALGVPQGLPALAAAERWAGRAEGVAPGSEAQAAGGPHGT